MANLEFEFGYTDFKQLQQVMSRRLFVSNRGRYGAALAGVVLCALFLTAAILVTLFGSRRFHFLGAAYPTSILLLLILLLFGALLSLIPAVRLRLTMLRSQVSDQGPLFGATRLSMDDDGLTVSRPLITTRYKWSAFRSAEIAKGAVILAVDNGMGIIIPAAAFGNDTARYEFAAAISRKIDAAKA